MATATSNAQAYAKAITELNDALGTEFDVNIPRAGWDNIVSVISGITDAVTRNEHGHASALGKLKAENKRLEDQIKELQGSE